MTDTLHTQASSHPDKKSFYSIEIASYLFLFVIIAIGIVSWWIDDQWFENVYVREDGFVENLTIVPLIVAIVVSARYLLKLRSSRSWAFSLSMLVIIVFAFFVAGEEISWGQRIFQWQSSQYFMANNAQQETNLHNLVVNGEKVNRVIFSRLLSILIGVYFFVIPVLHRKNAAVRKFIDWFGIPIPRLTQIVAAVTMVILLAIIQSAKNSEIMEFGITLMFLLILMHPTNAYVFKQAETPKHVKVPETVEA